MQKLAHLAKEMNMATTGSNKAGHRRQQHLHKPITRDGHFRSLPDIRAEIDLVMIEIDASMTTQTGRAMHIEILYGAITDGTKGQLLAGNLHRLS